MSSQFDREAVYYAQINSDGILKIWNTATNTLEQEYVPDIHLASPCTCLQFVECSRSSSNNGSLKNKKRKIEEFSTEIILGTTSGKLLVYSIAKGDIKCAIDGNINLPVGCLSANLGDIIYSGIDKYVAVCNIRQRKFFREWKADNNAISAVLAVPKTKRLLTASKCIKLWDSESQTVLKTFTGHSSNVHFLHLVPNSDSSLTKYVVSGSKGDRLINCWNISDDDKEVQTTASLLCEDYVQNASVYTTEDGVTKLTATVMNGTVYIFEVVLNGRCIKPIKSKSLIKVVADTGQKKEAVVPILIFSNHLRNGNSVLIAHGSSLVLTFEEVEITNKKSVSLVRQHPHKQKGSTVQTDKVITPAEHKATYLTPYSNIPTTTKRKLDNVTEVTMSRRLENLSFSKDYISVPRTNNMAHLLHQGLRSKDANIIKTVLRETKPELIRNTLRSLQFNVLTELFNQLGKYIQGYNHDAQAAQLWLIILLEEHVSFFLSNPEISELFAPIRNYIKLQTSSHNQKRNLKTKLELALTKVHTPSYDDDDSDEDSALIFNDRDSESESDSKSPETSEDEEMDDMNLDDVEMYGSTKE